MRIRQHNRVSNWWTSDEATLNNNGHLHSILELLKERCVLQNMVYYQPRYFTCFAQNKKSASGGTGSCQGDTRIMVQVFMQARLLEAHTGPAAALEQSLLRCRPLPGWPVGYTREKKPRSHNCICSSVQLQVEPVLWGAGKRRDCKASEKRMLDRLRFLLRAGHMYTCVQGDMQNMPLSSSCNIATLSWLAQSSRCKVLIEISLILHIKFHILYLHVRIPNLWNRIKVGGVLIPGTDRILQRKVGSSDRLILLIWMICRKSFYAVF